MMAKQTAVQQAQQALVKLEESRATISDRLAASEQRRDNAGDDVDILVETTQEADACRAALKHLDGESAELRSRLAEAEDAERREEVALLADQIAKYLAGLMVEVEELYARATDGDMAEVLRRHDHLVHVDKPHGKKKTAEFASLRQGLESILTSTGRWTHYRSLGKKGFRRLPADTN